MKNFNTLLGISKPRLYIALYVRGQQQPGDAKYHTALLLIPKGADPESDEQNSTRYHVNNPIVDGKQVWEFQPNKTRSLTFKLRALIFLGKVNVSETRLEDDLRKVPVISDDPMWRCQHWVWSAVDALARDGVIEKLPADPETIWNIGVNFADANPIDPDTGIIPTCTTAGEPTKSALEGA